MSTLWKKRNQWVAFILHGGREQSKEMKMEMGLMLLHIDIYIEEFSSYYYGLMQRKLQCKIISFELW